MLSPSPFVRRVCVIFVIFVSSGRLCRRKCQQPQMVDKVVYPGFSQNDSLTSVGEKKEKKKTTMCDCGKNCNAQREGREEL